jgi:hypothetical protein
MVVRIGCEVLMLERVLPLPATSVAFMPTTAFNKRCIMFANTFHGPD